MVGQVSWPDNNSQFKKFTQKSSLPRMVIPFMTYQLSKSIGWCKIQKMNLSATEHDLSMKKS